MLGKADGDEKAWPPPKADALRRVGGPAPESHSRQRPRSPARQSSGRGLDKVPQGTLAARRRLLL